MGFRAAVLLALWAIFAIVVPRAAAEPESAPVLLARIDGIIGPPSTHYLKTALETAEKRKAEAMILQINTPGGLETSMREMVQAILRSPVPVIGFVAPSGGRAASAGTYIIYASHVAAMAPGTNIGAATPVALRGDAPAPEKAPAEETAPANADALDRKAVQDAAAFMQSLASLRGRNAEWGDRAVRLGEAIQAREAQRLNVVDLIADDVEDLLIKADGRIVKLPAGERALSTRGRAIERIEPTLVTRILDVLANPNVAFLLMMVGVYGVIFEFMNPGSIVPGVIGATCLVLGLYALNQLPLNYAGLALIALGVAFIVAEAFSPSFGLLGIAGTIAFMIGAAMLIDTDLPQYRLAWTVIAGVGLLTLGFIALVTGFALRAHRRVAATGREAMIGARARVLDWSDGAGHVWIASERWRARGPAELSPGDWARVRALDGLVLDVTAELPPKGGAS